MTKSSFQKMILLGCLLVVVFTVTVIGVALQRSLKENLTGQLAESLHLQLRALSHSIRHEYHPGLSPARTDELADRLSQGLGARLTLIRPDGQVLGDSRVSFEKIKSLDNHGDRPEIRQALTHGRGKKLRYSATLGVDLLYVAEILGEIDRPVLVIRLALPLAAVQETLARTTRLIVVVTLLAVLLSIGAAYLVARRISRPVRELIGITRRIEAGEHSVRVRRYPAHEIGELGMTFDLMADHLEEEIRSARRGRDRLEKILSAMVDGVLVMDRDGRVVLTNQALSEMLELKADPLEKSYSEVIRNNDFTESVKLVLGSETEYRVVEFKTVGRTERELEVHLVALKRDPDRPGAVAVFHDLTERKKTEKIRRDFVANVSHELRTPLAAISGSVETLLSGSGKDKNTTRHFLEMIRRQSDRLTSLADDLLSLAAMEGSRQENKVTRLSAAELAESALRTMAQRAAGREMEIEPRLPDGDFDLAGVPDRLTEAVVNLLDNAIKYSDPGDKIELIMESGDQEAIITVTDHGPGIPPQDQDRIFERFYRVDKARSRKIGGTGLGLSIVKHAAQIHNGRVELDSSPGRGSTFRIIIPNGPTT